MKTKMSVVVGLAALAISVAPRAWAEDCAWWQLFCTATEETRVTEEAAAPTRDTEFTREQTVGKVRSGVKVRGETGQRVGSNPPSAEEITLRVSTSETPAATRPERSIIVQPSSPEPRRESETVVVVRDLSQALREVQGGEEILFLEGGNFELTGTLDRVRLAASPTKRATFTVSGDVVVRDTTLTNVDINLGTTGRLIYEGHIILDHGSITGGRDADSVSFGQRLSEFLISSAYAAGGITFECGGNISNNAGNGMSANNVKIKPGCTITNNGKDGIIADEVLSDPDLTSDSYKISNNGGAGINATTVNITGGRIQNNLVGVAGGTVTIESTEISGSNADGIFMDKGGTLTVLNAKIHDNGKAAIYAAGPVTVEKSELNGNKEDGIYMDKGGTLTVRNTKIHDNGLTATVAFGPVVIENSEVYNHPNQEQAAITVVKDPKASLAIRGSSIHDNHMGVYSQGPTEITANNLIRKNTTGIYAMDKTTIKNTSIHENTGAGVYGAPGSTIDLISNNNDHSIYGNGSGVQMRPGSSLTAKSNDILSNKFGIVLSQPSDKEKSYPAPKASIEQNQFYFNAVSVAALFGAPKIGPSNNFQEPGWCSVMNFTGNALYAYFNTWMHTPPTTGVAKVENGQATCSGGVDIANLGNSKVETYFQEPVQQLMFDFYKEQEKMDAMEQSMQKANQPKEVCPPGTPKQLCKFLP